MAADTPACPIDGTLLDPRLDRKPAPGLLLDTHVGEYLVKGVVGTGGMGVVYEGLQPVIGKRVAIKVLKREVASVPHEAARLLSEARLVNAIGHRGIIDIFSLGHLADGRQYLVMEFLVGTSLFDHIRKSAPLTVSDALQILDEILAALSAAHGAGVIHRDLKPSNVFLVGQPDGSRYIKLLDFGLAKQASLKFGDSPQTRVSRILGTPEFMAPEQARGQPVGPRSDLYALGCLAFEMLTARLPYEAGTGWEVVNQHLSAPVPLPSSIVDTVPEELDALVLSLLAKEPADRPASADVVRAEIKRIRKVLQVSTTRLEKFPEPVSRAVQVATDPWANEVTKLDAPRPTAAITIPTLEAAATLEGGTGTTLPSLDPAGQTHDLTSEVTAPQPARGVASIVLIGSLAGALLAAIWLWTREAPAKAPAPTVAPTETSDVGLSGKLALLSRIDGLRRPGNSAKAAALLTDFRAHAIAAQSPKELREIDRLVQEWERTSAAEK